MDRETNTEFHSKEERRYFLRQRAILIFIACFVLGVLVSSLSNIPNYVSLVCVLIATALYAAEKIWYKSVNPKVLLVSIILLSIALGSLRYNIKDSHTPNAEFESKVGEKIELVGVVVTEPEFRDASTRFVVRKDEERVLVNADLYTRVRYGDEVRVEGKLEKPGVIDDGVGRAFDYAAYLSKDDIYYILSFSSAEVISSGHGSPLKSKLFAIKRSLVSRMKDILPEPESSLLAGLIVSGKEAMPKNILEEFRHAGVVHIVVLSGFNISIIADYLRKMFESIFLFTKKAASPRLAAGASILGIILFILMTGAEATVVRAGIMVLVVIAAKLFGRQYSAERALFAAAFIMILHNPKILVFDPSFQLSFLATSALIYVVPIVERYLSKVPERFGRTMLATTLATQVVVLPYLMYSMGEISLVALLANMLILFIIPATMFVGFFAALISYLSTIVALPLSYIAHIFLSWILVVSHFLGSLSFASVKISIFPIWLAVLLYILLAICVRRLGSSPRKFAS